MPACTHTPQTPGKGWLATVIKFYNDMSTRIYPAPIYGPVHSRRLGLSLGINLLPPDGKSCTFDCIYCECGFNKDRIPTTKRPTRAEVVEALEAQLRKMRDEGAVPDVLTFAGNGEPTSHPEFAGIIDDTVRLRDEYCPSAKISVLSNSTFIHRHDVHEALLKVDNNILKLDTVSDDYISMVDRPVSPHYSARKIIDEMRSFGGRLIIQTMFMKGTTHGQSVDNTGEEFVAPWLQAVAEIAPREVMIYTIDRETPDHDLRKATPDELNAIRDRVEAMGIKCTASY